MVELPRHGRARPRAPVPHRGLDPRPVRPRRGQAQTLYRRFVAEGKKAVEVWGGLKAGVVLGSEAFARKLGRYLTQPGEVPRAQRFLARPALSDLFSGVEGNMRKRNARIHTAYIKHGYRLREIGEALGLHYSTVSRIVRRQGGRPA